MRKGSSERELTLNIHLLVRSILLLYEIILAFRSAFFMLLFTVKKEILTGSKTENDETKSLQK